MESLFCIWFGWCWNSIRWVILCYFEMTIEVLQPSWDTGDESKMVCKDKRLSLESWTSNPQSIVRYYKRLCVEISMNEFVMYGIVQEGHLPSLKPQAFLSGLWEDWQVYLPLSSQSGSLLNVCRPVGFRFGLQQKSFVMMKSQSFLSVFHFEGAEGLCGVLKRDLLRLNGFDEYVLLQW